MSAMDFKQALSEIQQAAKDSLLPIHQRLNALEGNASRIGGAAYGASSKSIADQFIGSGVLNELKQRGRGRVSLAFEETSLFPNDLQIKTTITSAAVGSSTPGILVPERMPRIIAPGVQAYRVRDLIPRFPTTQNAVEAVKENVFTNAASPTAETISKPESALTFTIDSVPVRTIAHWIPAARQVVDDLPVLRSYIDQRLMDGLMDIEDYELIGGDGTGQHISGLTTEATAYDTARNASGDTYIDKINHAISQIEDVKLRASGIILNPRDWRTMQLVKEETGGANTGSYILGGPKGDAQAVLWGLPVATTTAVPRGQFFVGAFATHCALFDRMSAVVEVSTEHFDFFTRNMIAIRCEERVAFFVTRADSVVFGTF